MKFWLQVKWTSTQNGAEYATREVDWPVVPRAGEFVAPVDGWASLEVTEVDYDHDGTVTVTMNLRLVSDASAAEFRELGTHGWEVT